ncbi:MAG: transcription antitermination factor NusB [Deltaproteobacteria bacterium GWA2_54_12]|nr:MAG: transcription antitermination factor NusB [Deltaproteobacteria bacterium GWA2_54_12]
MNLRRKARETALQALYKLDIAGVSGEEDLELEELAPGTAERRYCETLVQGVRMHLKDLDPEIEKYSENWTISRMSVVDRNILRIAVYELLYSSDVPYKVIIDEAVELAKKFGTDESGPFINGIIDRIRKAVAEDRSRLSH